jgi:hypothetical protein
MIAFSAKNPHSHNIIYRSHDSKILIKHITVNPDHNLQFNEKKNRISILDSRNFQRNPNSSRKFLRLHGSIFN